MSVAGAVMTFIQDQLLVCGPTQKCYSYDPTTTTWTNTVDMTTSRSLAVGILLNDTHWWVLGGSGVTSEIYNSVTNSFSPHVNLPSTSDGLMIGKLNDTTFVFMASTRYYLFQDSNWTQFASPPSNHDHGVFGLVTNSSGIRELVATDGHKSPGSGTFTGTDIYNFESRTWRSLGPAGKTQHIIHGKYVAFGDSVITVGGDSGFGTKLMYFDPELYEWRTLTTQLQTFRGGCCNFPYALAVPDSFAYCP